MNGYAGKILRIDLTSREIATIPTSRYEEWVGGHGMGSAIFFDLVKDKTIDGFDPANVVTMMTSPLSGTLVPAGAGRTEVQGIGVQSQPFHLLVKCCPVDTKGFGSLVSIPTKGSKHLSNNFKKGFADKSVCRNFYPSFCSDLDELFQLFMCLCHHDVLRLLRTNRATSFGGNAVDNIDECQGRLVTESQVDCAF